ncbi:MAG TPA: UDP-N-acetylmuramoyl-tripeptide--D-alanyl-D-alanine ligase [Thermomicrobiaceae bacterium]|nr:UDP-N-acetylmuramoyl-tripeptide--D-alanyl-D-alanine ligase [Thermomicrobiaceae bacterium]
MTIALRDVLEGTQGTLRGAAGRDLRFSRVWHDSREVERGDLFVAVVGERLDGHAFVEQAFARGAAGALVDRAHAEALGDAGGPLIVVGDTGEALLKLAASWRARHDVRVVGITGSIGKSSTKEAVWGVASQRFRTLRSQRSFNNEIGLPLSLLAITPETEVVVLELGGAYAFGEIERLAAIARPQIGVVTNVSHSHLSRMGSLEAIATTKAELPAALPSDGTAVLNGDDARVRGMAGVCRGRVILYGLSPDCEVRAEHVESHGLSGISLDLLVAQQRYHLHVPLLGQHSAHTVMAAIGVGLALGMTVEEMLPGLHEPDVQLRLVTVPAVGGAILIDDTYNANPTSSLAALNLLSEISNRRRIAVFGDMLELGSFEEEGHRMVGRRAAAVVDRLYTMGERARIIAEEAMAYGLPAARVRTVGSKRDLVDVLRDDLCEGDYVLVKGSRGVRMEDVVAELRDRSRPE